MGFARPNSVGEVALRSRSKSSASAGRRALRRPAVRRRRARGTSRRRYSRTSPSELSSSNTVRQM